MNGGSMRKILLLLPVLFIVAHIAAHAAAALQYPGGSRFQPYASGYSLQNNYWCDTLQRSGDNGIPNPGLVQKFFRRTGRHVLVSVSGS